MAEVDKWSIDRLDLCNWSTWKFQMKHLLLAKGLWDIVDGTEVLRENPTAQQKAKFKKRCQKAFSTIAMSVCSSQLYLISSCEEPNEAWSALCNHFERDTLVNKLMLKKQYFRMEMREGTSMESHIKTIKEGAHRQTGCHKGANYRRRPSCDSLGKPTSQLLNSGYSFRSKGCH